MNNYLDTALSLILIFFIFSIIAYIVQEIVAINLNYRGNVLRNSLAKLLDKDFINLTGRALGKLNDSGVNTHAFFNQAQIKSLQKNSKMLPSYIPATNFALALMNMANEKVEETAAADNTFFENVKLGLAEYQKDGGDIFVVLKDLAVTSATLKEFQQKVEAWYNDYMNRVTGWYKSHTTFTIRLIAIGITLFFNVNVIKLTKEIFTNSQLRGTLTAMAENVNAEQQLLNNVTNQNFSATVDSIDAANKTVLDTTKDPAEKSAIQKKIARMKADSALAYTKKSKVSIDTLYSSLNITGLPLGWNGASLDQIIIKNDTQQSITNVFFLLIGWGIAAGCISMGAPFWFDLLVKLVNVRRSGIVPSDDGKK